MLKHFSNDLRTRDRQLNRRRIRSDRRYVLCWLQQALRGVDNPIIDAAVELGNGLDLPVVIYHCVDNRHKYASHRFHRFILEASQSLERDSIKRRLRFCRYIRRRDNPQQVLEKLAESAACVITDDMPVYMPRQMANFAAERLALPLIAVDAACAVPMSLFNKKIEVTKAFRAAHRPLRSDALAAKSDIKPTVRKFTGKLCFEQDAIEGYSARRLDTITSHCDVDMSLPPSKMFRGDRTTAVRRLAHAIEHVVPRYKWTRNNPALADSTSQLSPYLHFGVLGPREIANAVNDADLHSAARWKFLDELLTWREFYFNHARFSEDPTAYENVPEWGRKTLDEHRSDQRSVIYSLEELTHARTDDEVWNAAQGQFLREGWMHNNLRMYWVKQIIKWTETPEKAWQTAVYLNDRLSLDGRDPATYGGIQWGFGRSKRGYREQEIYGWVPPKTAAAIRKRAGVAQWLIEQNGRSKPSPDMSEQCFKS